MDITNNLEIVMKLCIIYHSVIPVMMKVERSNIKLKDIHIVI